MWEKSLQPNCVLSPQTFLVNPPAHEHLQGGEIIVLWCCFFTGLSGTGIIILMLKYKTKSIQLLDISHSWVVAFLIFWHIPFIFLFCLVSVPQQHSCFLLSDIKLSFLFVFKRPTLQITVFHGYYTKDVCSVLSYIIYPLIRAAISL